MESEQKLVPLHTARKPPQHSHKMQSSEKQGARTKIPNKDSPRHFIVANDDNNHNIVTVNQDDYETLTRGHPSTRIATSETPPAPKAIGQRPQKTRRSYAGTITGIRFFPDQQEHPSTSQESQPQGDAMSERKREIP